jgi:hypothetical protein
MRAEHWMLLCLSLVPVAGMAGPDEDTPPSMELLEFLGSWESPEGEWVDPMQLAEDMEATAQTAQKKQTDEESRDD